MGPELGCVLQEWRLCFIVESGTHCSMHGGELGHIKLRSASSDAKDL